MATAFSRQVAVAVQNVAHTKRQSTVGLTTRLKLTELDLYDIETSIEEGINTLMLKKDVIFEGGLIRSGTKWCKFRIN